MKKLLFAAVAVVFATSVSADLQQYTFKGLFTSSDVPSSIAVGDSYTLTFQLDTSTTDSNASLQDGIFMGAVTDLNFSLNAGSSGNYGGGTMTSSQFLQLSDNYGYDGVNFYASPAFIPGSGLSFGNAGSLSFAEFGFNLYSNSQNLFNFTADSGQTLDSVLPALNLSSFDNTANVYMVFDNWASRVSGNITSISIGSAAKVPDSMGSTGLFVLISMGCLMVFRQRLVGTE